MIKHLIAAFMSSALCSAAAAAQYVSELPRDQRQELIAQCFKQAEKQPTPINVNIAEVGIFNSVSGIYTDEAGKVITARDDIKNLSLENRAKKALQMRFGCTVKTANEIKVDELIHACMLQQKKKTTQLLKPTLRLIGPTLRLTPLFEGMPILSMAMNNIDTSDPRAVRKFLTSNEGCKLE